MLSSLGYGTRREAQGIIHRGHVTVGGEVITDFAFKAKSEAVLVKGEPLEAPEGLLAVYHKPLGEVCTRAEGEGSTVYESLPPRWSQRNPPITSVGRLDKDTSGLLLITDRGDLVQRWTSPKSVMEKVYVVTVDKPLEESLIPIFASGTLMLRSEDKPCLPAKLEIIDPLHARLTLTQGLYHQVRRMFASQGWQVEALHRSRFGEYELNGLKPGDWLLVPTPLVGHA